mgnify:CR=1 FL=1
MDDKLTIEQRVAGAILERPVTYFEIDGVRYDIASPSIGTLIAVSEIISTLPQITYSGDPKEIAKIVLTTAKDFRPLADIVAILVLGAKSAPQTHENQNTIKCLFGRLKRRKPQGNAQKREQLAQLILDNMRPSVMMNILIKRLRDMEVGDFFAITTSLKEANILKPTAGVD